jgi:N-acetylmuramoyl-L-alanine amidase
LAAALLFAAWVGVASGPTTSTAWQGSTLVVVDAGHGGVDPGALAAGGREEKHINLAVARGLAAALAARGITVRLTRGADAAITGGSSTRELEARAQYANRLGATLLVSVHSNTEPTGTVVGPIVYYRAGSSVAQLLATDLEAALAAATGYAHRPRPAHHLLLMQADMPAVTVELGFLSTPQDLRRLASPAWQARLARALAAGVLRYLHRR